MSLLSYTGVGSVVLTVAGLGSMGLKWLVRAHDYRAARRPGSAQPSLDGWAVCSTNGRRGCPSSQQAGHDPTNRALLPKPDLPRPTGDRGG